MVAQVQHQGALPTLDQNWSQQESSSSVLEADAQRTGSQIVSPSGIEQVVKQDRDTSEPKKFPTATITGFFHLDTAYFSQDALSQLTLGDINDGLGFRRARLAAKGSVAEDISYILEFDIAQSQARFVDVWVQANNRTRFGKIRIGRYRQPFGMSELTSVRELPFLERPVTFALGPFRQTGVMLFDTHPNEIGTWAISAYRFLSDNFGNVFADSGYGLATRLTQIALEWGQNRLFHIGVDYSYNDPGRGLIQLVSTNEVFLAQNPNLGPSGLSVLPIVGVTPFVNTGVIQADRLQYFNIESALALGRMAIQSEARWVRVDRPAANTAHFPGAYAQVRYMLSGETIPYSKSNGVFGRVIPHCDWTNRGGCGAWEILGRISHIDLNDAGITGRRLTDLTVGCNWYWNRYTKLQFNWIHSRLNDSTLGDSTTSTFALRAQLDF